MYLMHVLSTREWRKEHRDLHSMVAKAKAEADKRRRREQMNQQHGEEMHERNAAHMTPNSKELGRSPVSGLRRV